MYKLQVVQTAGILAAGAGTFPSAKGLEARPGAGSGALRTVGVGHASFDLFKEPISFLWRTVEPGGQTIIDVIGHAHGFVQISEFANGGNGHEHFVFPQAVSRGNFRKGWSAEVTLGELRHSVRIFPPVRILPASCSSSQKPLIIAVGTLVDHRTHIDVAVSGVADHQLIGRHPPAFVTRASYTGASIKMREASRAFLPLQTKGRADDARGGDHPNLHFWKRWRDSCRPVPGWWARTNCALPKSRKIFIPTSNEPVKVMPSTSGLSISA